MRGNRTRLTVMLRMLLKVDDDNGGGFNDVDEKGWYKG